jgi:Ohr subfamily peroxiredoxin
MKTLYTAYVTAQGGRDGRVRSQDGVLDLQLSVPKSMGGAGVAATNPEQLFAAGYAACFESALRLVARKRGTTLTSVSVTAEVSLSSTEQGAYQLGAELHVHLPDVPRDTAQALAQAAHQVCPYSNATRGNIEVKVVVD